MVTTRSTQIRPLVSLQEVRTRHADAIRTLDDQPALRALLHSTAGLPLGEAVADIPDLSAEVEPLRHLIADLRLDLANLVAGSRATLAAEQDGELDPLFYLRDELSAQGEAGGAP
ncbi:hypothetical protein [Sphaerisporangium fuscum]|uniref:hypothetical protein n=1 Tax=Sphaerisporangium fuscum TaxID=2835868 RepID=UPI001BDC8968|nr:hypothetical protein [Sphaerisporangium fuscum]